MHHTATSEPTGDSALATTAEDSATKTAVPWYNRERFDHENGMSIECYIPDHNKTRARHMTEIDFIDLCSIGA